MSAAPSNANTSGLEVSLAAVLARAICESEGKDWAALDNTREDVERWFRLGEVTAASAQARIAELEAELEEAQTIDAGFWKWLGERDLQPDGPDVEWGDIVVALTEHEQNAYGIADKANDRATAAEARADRLAEISSKLDAAISWLDYPFIDNRTPEAELRQRVGFMMKDAEPHRAALQQEKQP